MTYDACSCDYDPPDFVVHEMRKARKPHKCVECRAVVVPGERYEHVRGKWEGEMATFNTCALCVELRQWARISVPCFCWTYSDLHENVRDMVAEVRADVPQGFVFEWGRRMVKIDRARLGVRWPRKWQRTQPPGSAAQIVAECRA